MKMKIKGKTHMAYMFVLLSIIREIVSARAEKYMKIFQIKKMTNSK